MTGQTSRHHNSSLRKLASVKLPVIAVSIAFSSHFATAQGLTATPSDSMQFEESSEYTQQALTPDSTAVDALNLTTVNPNQAPVPAQGTPVPGQPVVYGSVIPKAANGNKSKDKNPMDQVMQMMGGGGNGASTAKKSQSSFGTPSEQASTAAAFTPPGIDCPECNKTIRNGSPNKIDIEKAADFSKIDGNPSLSEKEKCFAKYTAGQVMEDFPKTQWRHRTRSGGDCALGVRTLLDMAGLKKSGTTLGHAIHYHGRNTLRPLGYRQLAGVTEENAPPGAILVYKGPKSPQYLAGKIGSDGTGTTLGHVTIKGADGKFYTDGKTSRGAGANRDLVGVYVMSTCLQCKPAVKSRCEGAGGGSL